MTAADIEIMRELVAKIELHAEGIPRTGDVACHAADSIKNAAGKLGDMINLITVDGGKG